MKPRLRDGDSSFDDSTRKSRQSLFRIELRSEEPTIVEMHPGNPSSLPGVVPRFCTLAALDHTSGPARERLTESLSDLALRHSLGQALELIGRHAEAIDRGGQLLARLSIRRIPLQDTSIEANCVPPPTHGNQIACELHLEIFIDMSATSVRRMFDNEVVKRFRVRLPPGGWATRERSGLLLLQNMEPVCERVVLNLATA